MRFGEALVWVLCMIFLVRLFNCLLYVISGWLSMVLERHPRLSQKGWFSSWRFCNKPLMLNGQRDVFWAWYPVAAWPSDFLQRLTLYGILSPVRLHDFWIFDMPQSIGNNTHRWCFFFNSLCWRRMLFFLSAMWDQWIPPLHRQGNLGNLLSHG